MTRITLAAMLLILLAACNGGYIPLAVATPIVWPSPLPAILSPTPPYIPTATPKIILPASPTFTQAASVTPTWTITSTRTSTPTVTSTITSTATFTSTFASTPTSTSSPTPTQLSSLTLEILGCNTSIDLFHQMGEVTNAYPVVSNTTGENLTNVCATLSASDEARIHPDKTACVAELPAGYQVTLKLTVDTGTGKDTAIQVLVVSNQGFTASASRSSCRDIGLPGWLSESVGVIHPIP